MLTCASLLKILAALFCKNGAGSGGEGGKWGCSAPEANQSNWVWVEGLYNNQVYMIMTKNLHE